MVDSLLGAILCGLERFDESFSRSLDAIASSSAAIGSGRF
jgi:hypothetical protein